MANVKKMKKTKGKTNKPAKRSGNKTEEIMDRATLKGIASKLKGAGSKLKVLKGDADEALQRKVSEALQQLPSAEVLEKLGRVDPGKLVALKRDCLGIFIDLSDVACVRCRDVAHCMATFIQNLKGGMSVVDGAVVAEGDEPKPKEKTPTKPIAATRYESGRLIFIRDVPNPNPKGDDYHDTIQRVLDDQPDNLGELRAIIERDFDLEGDGDFMKFVTALRDPKEGVIKLDVDLSEGDKAELKAAGYDL